MESDAGNQCPAEQKLDPRVKRTRKLLEDALKDLMSERSFDEISVADIAERATVNRATFYAHFEDKHHLAESTLVEDFERMVLAGLSPSTPFGAEGLTQFSVATFEFVSVTFNRCGRDNSQCTGGLGSILQRTLERNLLHWVRCDSKVQRVFPDATAETVANVLAWTIYGAAIRWNGLPTRPDAVVAARETIGLLFPK